MKTVKTLEFTTFSRPGAIFEVRDSHAVRNLYKLITNQNVEFRNKVQDVKLVRTFLDCSLGEAVLFIEDAYTVRN